MKLLYIGLETRGPVTAERLAIGSGADELLVVRVMRMLVTMGIFEEVAHHTYIATPLAGIWASGSPLREAVIHVASQIPPTTMLPEYFEEKGYHNSTDAEDGPFQYTYKTKTHFFDWLSQRPKVQSAFNTTMEIARQGCGQEWFEFYPVAEKLTRSNPDPTSILLVDIEGNVGYDLVNFQNKFPGLPGRLVFKDLPAIVSSVDNLPDGVEPIGHDFFTPQPSTLRNAKALLPPQHPARLARQTKHIRSWNASGRSWERTRFSLINENALPDDDVGFYPAALDLIVMGVFASLDRTVGEFEELLDSAGFKVVGTWKPGDYGPGSGTFFEACLKGWVGGGGLCGMWGFVMRVST